MKSKYGLAHDAITGLTEAQPPIERIAYKQFLLQELGFEEAPASEAVTVGAGRAVLVNALYNDIKNKDNVDFGKIPDSAGDITKLVYYKNMASAMRHLNELIGENANPDMIRMNELHQAIIQERNNFEFGFKLNIAIIKYAYNTLCEALMDLINMNISSYVDVMRDSMGIEVVPGTSTSKGTDNTVTRAVDTFLDLRKKGEWGKLIKSYRSQYGKNLSGAAVATGIFVGGITIVGIIALLYGIRQLIYLYYHSLATVEEKARVMAEYIDEVKATETNSKALKRQTKMSSQLHRISDKINHTFAKDEGTYYTEIKKADASLSKTMLQAPHAQPSQVDGYVANGQGIEFDW